ncbi:MAG: beta-ketoacyl-[acyl-carrier-protein] synthase II [Deltaproteobacteria bacterium]|nr:MAG: beta-ketoacyl-[acyl-carrier-protein] synthase II [Deltaproteobacteria bacterium]
MERVVITGIGLVTPSGIRPGETWRSLLAGQSGIAPITLFDPSDYAVRFAGEVKGFDGSAHVPKKKLKEMGRYAQLSIAATHACLDDSGIELSDQDREVCGTFIGVGLGGLENIYKYSLVLRDRGPRKISPYFIPSVIANLAAGQVAIEHGLGGPSYCTTSACASSAHALGDAMGWIQRGRTPLMLAGGSEACITGLGLAGFTTMFALSRRNDEPERASRPWDRGRDGFVMAEGAATLLLESLDHAKARGARIYAELTGYGATCDGYHITQPEPGARGALRAMRMALAEARLDPSQIDYINAHGTSTPAGDAQEAKAIIELCGDHALSKKLWVSSTKSAMGHLLGGAGAVEAALCALALVEGAVPPTLNLDDPEPDCPLDFVAHQARERDLQHVMSNSFGFGGTNATLILSRGGF